MEYNVNIRFEWHELKNQANHRKHRVWFEEAQTVWSDRQAREFFDSEHSDEEDRYIRIGMSSRERLLVVIFCERSTGNTFRIISARQGTVKERLQYEEGIRLKKA